MNLYRIHNFSAGPAQMPVKVLQKAQEEFLSYQDRGFHIGEISHRSKTFDQIINSAKSRLINLLGAEAKEFHILFLQGGATTQFAQLALNFCAPNRKIGIIDTGIWSQKALKYLKQQGKVDCFYSGSSDEYRHIPTNWDAYPNDYDFVHFTSNNTIYGTEFKSEPNFESCSLICDASSNILSKPIDLAKYGMIYAGAQKNLGPAGLTLVLLRKSFLEEMHNHSSLLPAILDYRSHTQKLFNTPPTFAIYMTDLVLEWLEEQGGLERVHEKNQKKAQLLYNVIDQSKFYVGLAEKNSRSLMNVSFKINTNDAELMEERFVKMAEEEGMIGLKGHRSSGGLRASIYNACPLKSVDALVSFMQNFENKFG